MLITGIMVARGPILNGTSKATNNLNLILVRNIAKIKDDGGGGYWLHFKPLAHGDGLEKWSRVVSSNIVEVSAIEESSILKELADKVSAFVENKPDGEMMPLANALAKELDDKRDLFDHLASQQLTSQKWSKILSSIDVTRGRLKAWQDEVEEMLLGEHEEEQAQLEATQAADDNETE